VLDENKYKTVRFKKWIATEILQAALDRFFADGIPTLTNEYYHA